MRILKLGQTEGDQTIVESGLAAGEIVVTEGTDRLLPGTTKVSLKDSSKKKKPGKPADQKSPTDDGKTPAAPADGGDQPAPAASDSKSGVDQPNPGSASSQQQPNDQTGAAVTKHKNHKNGTKTEQ